MNKLHKKFNEQSFERGHSIFISKVPTYEIFLMIRGFYFNCWQTSGRPFSCLVELKDLRFRSRIISNKLNGLQSDRWNCVPFLWPNLSSFAIFFILVYSSITLLYSINSMSKCSVDFILSLAIFVCCTRRLLLIYRSLLLLSVSWRTNMDACSASTTKLSTRIGIPNSDRSNTSAPTSGTSRRWFQHAMLCCVLIFKLLF